MILTIVKEFFEFEVRVCRWRYVLW